MANRLSRREFLRGAGVAALGSVIAACQPQVVEKTVEVVKTVEVEVPVEVEKTVVVKETVEVAPEMPEGVKIDFWTMNYGDVEEWKAMFDNWAVEFREESGIEVETEIVNWAQARDTWLLVSSGGVHPDCADMFWLYSHVQLGKGKYGPMPITEFKDIYWPDLEERYFAGALKDVFWQGEFYGIPWRGDIRPMLYRTDFLEEAGFSDPPETWDDVVEYGKALTKRDAAGNVEVWGVDLWHSGSQKCQGLLPLVWQAGGEFMTPDGREATVDTPEVQDALQYMYECIWEHEITPKNGIEPAWNGDDEFMASRVAMRTMTVDSMGSNLDREVPELSGKWAGALPPKRKRIASYSGAGYWGVLRGTEYPDEACRWIEFLSRDEHNLYISKYLNRVCGNKNVMSDPFWQSTQWLRTVVATLEYAHTSQHPTPAWAKLMRSVPGGVLFDMMQEAWIQKLPIPEVTARAQKRMQEEMDAALE